MRHGAGFGLPKADRHNLSLYFEAGCGLGLGIAAGEEQATSMDGLSKSGGGNESFGRGWMAGGGSTVRRSRR